MINGKIEWTINSNVGDLLPPLREFFEELLPLIEALRGLARNWEQRIIGLHSYIPAMDFDYELVHVFEFDVYLTGVTYSQTGWKVLDYWDLYVGEEMIFDCVFTKELGEYKHLNNFYGVPAGTPVKVVHHNKSGNSKQVWFDLHYLNYNPNPYVPPGPSEPLDPDFPEGRDFVIKIEWTNATDIDCCFADGADDTVLMGYQTDSLGESPDRIFKDKDRTGSGE